MVITMNLPETLLEKVEVYKESKHKQNFDEAVTELLQEALTFSSRQYLLETLQRAPETETSMTQEEQFAMIDAVRQEIYGVRKMP
jgi:metal-responsive CopG/Arc/MetJ family transcriptional regulator